MKKILAVIALPVVALSVPSAAFAQATDTATASGSTTIVQPITITKDADLAFGRIVKPSSGTGTVAITDAADAVSAGSGAVALTGITTSRAKFTIDGEGGQAISITVPTNFDMIKGADSITVTLDPDLSASETLSNALGSAGSLSLNVGGSFSLPSAKATGMYTGTFDVTVAYQ